MRKIRRVYSFFTSLVSLSRMEGPQAITKTRTKTKAIIGWAILGGAVVAAFIVSGQTAPLRRARRSESSSPPPAESQTQTASSDQQSQGQSQSQTVQTADTGGLPDIRLGGLNNAPGVSWDEATHRIPTVSIANFGNGAAPALTVGFRVTWKDQNSNNLGNPIDYPLPALTSGAVSSTAVSVPPDATVYMNIVIDPNAVAGEGTWSANNTATPTIPLPDLSIALGDVTFAATTNVPSFVLHNQGALATPGMKFNGYRLEWLNGAGNPFGTIVHSAIPALNPGASQTLSLTGPPPAQAASLRLTFDPENVIFESNEVNNQVTKPTPNLLPDLRVFSPPAGPGIVFDSTTRVPTVHLINAGQGASPALSVGLRVQWGDVSGLLIGEPLSFALPSLPAGGTYVVNVGIAPPLNAQYLNYVIDPLTAGVNESAEENNEGIKMLPLPDLTASPATVSLAPGTNAPTITIQNLGQGVAPAFNSAVRAVWKNVSGSPIGSALFQNLPLIPAGAAHAFTLGAAPAGAASLSVTINPDGALAESSMTNNEATKSIP